MKKLTWAMAALLACPLTPAIAQETIKIGVVQALTGPGASYGQDALAGIRLAVEDINGTGGVGGKKLELVVRDDEGNPAKGKQMAEQLVYRDNVLALLANTLTTPNLASQDVTAPAGVPHIVAGTTSNIVCNAKGEGNRPCPANVFRLAILNSWQGKKIADYVAETIKAKTVAILHDSTEYGQDGFKMLSGPLKARGIEIVYTGTFGFGEKNFKPHILKVKESGAEAILTWTLDFLVAQIALARAEAGLTLPLLASSATTTFGYRDLAKDAANGTLIVDGMKPVMVNPTTAQKALIDRYAKEAKRDPAAGIQYWTLTYYDAVHWLADAIGKAGPDRKAIVAALGTSHASFTGKGTGVDYKFTAEERNGRDPGSVVMTKVANGQLVEP